MSGENKEQYHHLLREHHFLFHDDLSSFFSQKTGGGGAADTTSLGFDSPVVPPPLASFSDLPDGSVMDYGMLARALDVPCWPPADSFGFGGTSAATPLELVVDANNNGGNNSKPTSTGGCEGTTPVTPYSSASSSSNEAAGEEDDARRSCKKDQLKLEHEEAESEKKQLAEETEKRTSTDHSKKLNKQRKKGEKQQRMPRFAFMTKSEVDNLEDGYRWRKYGQKAVKNSPYPRSYYRCTTQKCSVKKRVERSYQDPAIVITTYEGQHTHPSPATVRASVHFLAPPPTASPTTTSSFHRNLFMHQAPPLFKSNSQLQAAGNTNPNGHLPSLPPSLQQLQFSDHCLFQENIVPSFINKGSQP